MMDCMNCTEYQGSQDYIFVDNIDDASHWVASFDPDSVVKDYIIPNKIYQVIDQDFILSEDGCFTTYWMCHKGQFINMKGN